MQEIVGILRDCALFDGIDAAELSELLHCMDAKTTHFDRKYTILAEGSPTHTIGIVLTGAAHIVHLDCFGNRSILGHIRPGESFGEAFACAGTPALPVSVVAEEPCDVLLLRSARMLHSCESHCAFHQRLIYNLMRSLAMRSVQFHQKLYILSRRTTRDKLLAYLAAQARQAGASRFDIPFDRQALADYLQVDRSGLSVEIGRLQREGVLVSHRRHFELLGGASPLA